MNRLRIFLTVLLVPLLGGIAQAKVAQKDTVRILAIGNSFSEDAIEQNLHGIAQADGRVLIIGNMFIPGCSLERHVQNLRENKADYRYRKIMADGVMVQTDSCTLETALSDETWNYVSLQQASPLSGKFETYEEWLPELHEYVRTHTGPQTEIILHMTWAYGNDVELSAFKDDYGGDQMQMYESIVDAYTRGAELVGIKTIVPCGTAVQNARTSFIGDHMNRDGYHLNLTYGRFTAACTWYEKLFGGIRTNDYVPKGLSEEYVKVAHESARQAVRHPYKVTHINVK